MAWIGALSGAMGASSSGVGANLATGYYNRMQSNKAWQRQKNAMKSRYQWTMGDLKAAGLNPILAYQQGPSGGVGVPQSAMGSVSTPDIVGSAKEGALFGSQLANINANTAKATQEARLTKAVADKEVITKKPYTWLNHALEDPGEFLKGAVNSAKGVGGFLAELFAEPGKSKFDAPKYEYYDDRKPHVIHRGRVTGGGSPSSARGTIEEWY